MTTVMITMISRGKGGCSEVEGKGGINGDRRRFDWGDEHTIQYTDDVLSNCTLETHIVLLTNVTPINSMTF